MLTSQGKTRISQDIRTSRYFERATKPRYWAVAFVLNNGKPSLRQGNKREFTKAQKPMPCEKVSRSVTGKKLAERSEAQQPIFFFKKKLLHLHLIIKTSNMSTQTDNPTNQMSPQDETALANAISLAVQTESAFKLYSFRIITHENYKARIRELVSEYQKIEFDLQSDPDYVFTGQPDPHTMEDLKKAKPI